MANDLCGMLNYLLLLQEVLQQRAAKAVVGLLQCCAERKASPNGKVTCQMCIHSSWLVLQLSFHRIFAIRTKSLVTDSPTAPLNTTLKLQILNNLCAFLCEDNSFTPRACDFPAAVNNISMEHLTSQPPSDAVALGSTDDAIRAARVKKRGAALALTAVANAYGKDVFSGNVALWQRVHVPLQQNLGATSNVDEAAAQEAIDALQVGLQLVLE